MIFCSTIIPTIGRESLERAVTSVLDQELSAAEFEIIIVNDSGFPLQPASWLQDHRVQILETGRRERSVARNSGAAIALGHYLHFLDDDDWLLPNAIQEVRDFAGRNPDSAWLLGGSKLFDRQGDFLIELHHDLPGDSLVQVMAGEWLPLQASFIKKVDFFRVGGFNPLLTVTEDIDLARLIMIEGRLSILPSTLAGITMGVDGSSTDYERAARQSRMAREEILDRSGFFSRISSSSDASSFWRGRLVRVYLTSMIWNLRSRKIFTAVSRFLYTLAGFFRSGVRVLSPTFWHALLREYDSPTFREGFRGAGRPVEVRTLGASQKQNSPPV